MSESSLDPNEVARLLSLPPGHPERERAMRDPEFASLALALAEFEAPRAAGREQPAEPVPRARAGAGGPPLGWLLGAFATPARRGALAFAGLVLVAGIAWWSFARSPREGAMRGVEEAGTFALLPPHDHGTATLEWTAAPHADGYRVVFLGPGLDEVARVDAGTATRLVLRPGALPAGLASGARLSVEVVALRGGETVATTAARSIRIP